MCILEGFLNDCAGTLSVFRIVVVKAEVRTIILRDDGTYSNSGEKLKHELDLNV